MLLVGDSMKRTEFLSHKHIVAASATPEIVYSLNDTLCDPTPGAGVTPKATICLCVARFC